MFTPRNFRRERYQFISLVFAIGVIVIGVIGLVGWLIDNQLLKSFFSSGASMKVNTSILLIFGGTTLLAIKNGYHKLALLVTTFLMLLTLIILSEHVFAVNLFIDQLFIKDLDTDPAVAAPGRTSLLTALDFLWIGLSVLLFLVRRYQASQLLAIGVSIIVYISLTGHLFKIEGFYILGQYSGIAFHTSIGLLLLALGIICMQVHLGWLGLIYKRFSKQKLGYYIIGYCFAVAPLIALLYFNIIKRGELSQGSEIIVLFILVAILSTPVCYLILKLIEKINNDLSESDTRLQMALEAAELGSFDINLDSSELHCSPQFREIFGLPPVERVDYDALLNCILPAQRENIRMLFSVAITSRMVFKEKFQIQWDNGNVHWVFLSARPIYDQSGHAKSLVGVAQNITEREYYEQELQTANEEITATNEDLFARNRELGEAQMRLNLLLERLRESEYLFRHLVKDAPVAIHVLNGIEMISESANDKMLSLLGRTSDEIIGRPYRQALPELEFQPFLNILKEVYISGQTYYGAEEKVVLNHNGSLTDGYFNFIYQPMKDGVDKTYGIMIVASEVTDLVKARKDREVAENSLQMAIEGAKIGSWYIEPETKALKYNTILAEIFGYEGAAPMTYDQAIGQVSEEHRTRIVGEIEDAIASERNYDITYSQRRFNDNQKIWLRSIGKLASDESGNNNVFTGVVMDITEQKQDDIRKNDFIGMVSHELKTPLTSLFAIVQLVNMKLLSSTDTILSGAMKKAEIQVKRMTNLIDGFLNVSRLESGKLLITKGRFDLDELVVESIGENQLLSTKHLVKLGHCDQAVVNADRGKISTVISNLLSNAIKYSPSGSEIQVHCELKGDEAVVSVKDMGIGIAEKDLLQVFERYYRVERNHAMLISGFGIGLYLSSEIISGHHGRIWAESKLGQGSTFYFALPLAQD